MSEPPPRYLAYMLRIWQAGSGGHLTWRASVESPHTGERQSFASLQALCAFLHDRLGEDENIELTIGSTPDETPSAVALPDAETQSQ